MKNALCFITVIILVLSCRAPNEEKNAITNLIGSWYLELNESDTIRFTPDGYYLGSKYNSKTGELKGLIQKNDGSIEEIDFGKLKYESIETPSSYFLPISIYGEKNNLEFMRKDYILQRNSLIEIKYKMGTKELADDIQIAQRYFRVNTNNNYTKTKDSLYLFIPKSTYSSELYLAYLAETSTPITNKNVYFDTLGRAEVAFKENISVFLDGTIKSYRGQQINT